MKEFSDDDKARLLAKIEQRRRDREEQIIHVGERQPRDRRKLRAEIASLNQFLKDTYEVVGDVFKMNPKLQHAVRGMIIVALFGIPVSGLWRIFVGYVQDSDGSASEWWLIGLSILGVSRILHGAWMIGPATCVALGPGVLIGLICLYMQWKPSWHGCVRSKDTDPSGRYTCCYPLVIEGIGAKQVVGKSRYAIWEHIQPGDYLEKEARSYEVSTVTTDENAAP